MGLFQIVLWGMWVLEIFCGFTFTDWYDFIPIACLFAGLVAIVVTAGFEARPASLPLKGSLVVLAFWPVLPTFSLLMLALQFVHARGRWPEPMFDDPKNLGLPGGYEFWFHATGYFEAVAGAAFLTFFPLLSVNRSRLSKRFQWTIWGICGIAILVSIFDPGMLGEWWLD